MRVLIIRFLRVVLRTAHPCLQLFMLVGLLFPALAAAVPNTAPTFFVGDGIVTIGIDYASGMANVGLYAGGKILVAGAIAVDSRYDSKFALERHTTDGSLDASFGTGGIVTTAIGFIAEANSITVQADGRILVAGTSDSKFALARYNTDGSLDASFGTGGIVTTIIDFSNYGSSVTVQADGKILLVGTSIDSNNYPIFALLRYNSDGSLDNSFDTDGIAIGYNGSGGGVIVQADGRILVAWNGNSEFGLARYNTDGSLDTSFGTGGMVTVAIGYTYGLPSVGLQADGKILVACGNSNSIGGSDGSTLVRYHSNGSLDAGFGTGGMVTQPWQWFQRCHTSRWQNFVGRKTKHVCRPFLCSGTLQH